jgi:class 3 adenylate cyclase/TolB-like protein/Tfp pilus assembly protein PilF
MKSDFLKKIDTVIEDHLSDEQFGVSALADEVNMSRSNLLRKVKHLTNLSVSQYIRNQRLAKALMLLRETDDTVSEISYNVGFSSTSYFIKCFHEQYGFTPGETRIGSVEQEITSSAYEVESHQLVAIMFTDISGYTALMQRDEEMALNTIKRHREVFNSTTKKFNGSILQYYGDGTLSTFPSAIDAVHCAINMQSLFRESPKIPVRIGIHSGDIIFNANGIIGDGVNVASRIESLALPGSILISEKVFDEVKNQKAIQTLSLGEIAFKNVDKPIEVFAISNPGLVVPTKYQLAQKLKGSNSKGKSSNKEKNHLKWLKWTIALPVMLIFSYFIMASGLLNSDLFNLKSDQEFLDEKSIAVLPFINDSNDSSNVYIINGLMEAILNNFQKIEDLRVISRTSVEQYRNTSKLLPDIAKELQVKYLVGGSGQKINDQVFLNVQLIDAFTDKQLWSKQYKKEINDIFSIQLEVAKDIANEISIVIEPEEAERINILPTEDPIAYDFFLQGQEYMNKGSREGLIEAIPLYQKAIYKDQSFGDAHASLAISYYYLDALHVDKIYIDSINTHADRALLFSPQSAQSLIAKALYYYDIKEYHSALPYLETALKYNPNSATVINFLSDYYTSYQPDTEKYLEYALKGAQLNTAHQDSSTSSYSYLHISNALIQTGFMDQAESYINKSIKYDPDNLFAQYLKGYIIYAKKRNLRQAKEIIADALELDPTRADIIQELAKVCFYMRDYQEAYKFYALYLDIKEQYKLDIYPGEYAKIAFTMSKSGKQEAAEAYITKHKEYADNDESIYKHLSLAVYYSYLNKKDESLHHLRLFSEEDNFHYWIILFLRIDPLLDPIIDLPETQQFLNTLEVKFWKNHEKVKKTLEEKNLI